MNIYKALRALAGASVGEQIASLSYAGGDLWSVEVGETAYRGRNPHEAIRAALAGEGVSL